MFKRRVYAIGLGAALIAGPALAALHEPAGPTARSYYYWNHPKLGPVKVDPATQAMVTGASEAGTRRSEARQPRRVEYWIDPKGSARRIDKPAAMPGALGASDTRSTRR